MNYAAMNQRDGADAQLKMPDINVALPVMNYGGGHQQLIEIAKALNKNAKLLILDEPSSSLTASETETLLDHRARVRSRAAWPASTSRTSSTKWRRSATRSR